MKDPASAGIPARRPARRSGEDRHQAIITSLYEAATSALDWTEALRPMSWSFRSLSGVLFIEGGHGDVDLLAMPGWSARAQRLYAMNFRHVDPYAAFARRSPQERCILGPEVVAPDILRASEIWFDFMRLELPAFHFIGAILPLEDDEGARLAWHRSDDAPQFDETDRHRFQSFMPHLKRALQFQRRLQRAERSRDMLDWTLDRIELGLLVVDVDAQVRYANRAAEHLCAAAGIALGSLADRGLRLPVHADNRRLRRLLAAVAGGEAGGSLVVRQPDGRRLAALIHPLPPTLAADWNFRSPGQAPGGGASTLALVSLRPASGCGGGPAGTDGIELLRDLFGLTWAEADVAIGTASRLAVPEIAKARATSINTVRAQIRQVLVKTQCDSLRDLACLILRLI